jgi:hypothetical protein
LPDCRGPVTVTTGNRLARWRNLWRSVLGTIAASIGVRCYLSILLPNSTFPALRWGDSTDGRTSLDESSFRVTRPTPSSGRATPQPDDMSPPRRYVVPLSRHPAHAPFPREGLLFHLNQ